MDWTSWIGFVGVALFAAFTPGPAVLMAISNSLSVGPRLAMVGSLGNAVGLLLLSSGTAVGLGVLLAASSQAFMVLKLLGACYLIFLGIRQWRQAGSGALAVPAAGDAALASWPRRRLFGRGMVVALTNPKALLFFSALFPQFMNHPDTVLRDFTVLTLTFVCCAMLAHGFYVLLARGVRRGLEAPHRLRALNRAFGACFVGLGVSLLAWRGRAQ